MMSKLADWSRAWGWLSALSFCPGRNRGRFFFESYFSERYGWVQRTKEVEKENCVSLERKGSSRDAEKNLQLEKIKHIIARAEIERTLKGSEA